GRRHRGGRPRGEPARGDRARARVDRLRGGGRATRRAGGVLALMRLAEALARPGLRAIAEFKRRSPSMGDIRPDARVEQIVPAYTANDASAISVLVDEGFGGSLRAKGSFATEDHLRELREAGADAALLILRDLDDETCATLMRYAESIGLDTLVEAHDLDELARATRLGAPVVGINARDLSTFRIDRHAQLELVAHAARSGDRVIVAESAIHTRAQAAAAELAGADAVLVGTALMQAPDPGAKLRELLSRPLVKVCGLTRQEDVDQAVGAGADLLGFIFAEGSPRRADAVLDVPETALSVAVSVGDPVDAGADLVQIYAAEGGKVRGRGALLMRDGWREQVLVLDLPWQETDPAHWDDAAQ